MDLGRNAVASYANIVVVAAVAVAVAAGVDVGVRAAGRAAEHGVDS